MASDHVTSPRNLAPGVARLQRQRPVPSVEITQITADSRQVQPGALFVAVQGGAVAQGLAKTSGR